MNINRRNSTLCVTGIRELNAANAHSFRAEVATALSQDLQTVNIDLSDTQTLDGAGLGALVSLYETANPHRNQQGIAFRLTNPTPSVQQMIELARLHHLFEIAPPDSARDAALPQSA